MDNTALETKLDHLAKNQEEVLKALRSRSKDNWDRFAIITTFLTSVTIGLLGLYFTNSYNVQQDRARLEQRKLDEAHRMHELDLEKLKSAAGILPASLPAAERLRLAAEVMRGTPYQAAFQALLAALSTLSDDPSTPPETKAKAEKALAAISDIQVVPEKGGSPRGRAALHAAVAELAAGAREIGGANRGPFVEKYLKVVGLPAGSPWSVAFVSWCYSTVAGGSPFQATAYGPGLLDQFRKKGWLRTSASQYTPAPGDIVWKKTANGRGTRLLGILQRSENGTLYVIQGNSNKSANAVGVMVAARVYAPSDGFLFGHVP